MSTSGPAASEAEAAVAAVLEESPQPPAEPSDPGQAVTPASELAAVTDVAEPCTESEARQLVADAKRGLELFDNSMQEIVRRQAWEPLGYNNPRDFVLAEFGPSDNDGDDADGRVSQQHAYRLARLCMFMYGLVERVGDEALSVEMTERALRSVPAGRDGEHDAAMLDRIEAKLDGVSEPHEVQEAVDSEIKRAREEFSPGRDDAVAGEAPIDAERLANLGIDPDDLEPDEQQPAVHGDDSAANTSAAGPKEERGASRADLAAAYDTTSDVDDETLESAQQFTTLMRAIRQLSGCKESVADLLDHAENDDIAELETVTEDARAALDEVSRELETRPTITPHAVASFDGDDFDDLL